VSRPARLPALLRSEWTKLRSLRSTWWSAAVFVVFVGAVGWLAAASTPSADRPGTALAIALLGFAFGQLVLVVLGVLAGAGEFATGLAVASLVAAPRRVRWLAAKTVVVAGAAAVLTAGVALVCWLAARTQTAVPGGVPLADGEVLRPLLLQVAGAALLAVLGVGLGVLLRSTAGGVGIGVALVFVLPPVFAFGAGSTGERLSQALPALRVGEDAFLAVPTSWPVGLAVAAGWAAVAWTAAAVTLVRRDV
jgi:ABC-2 type transport system permease protein